MSDIVRLLLVCGAIVAIGATLFAGLASAPGLVQERTEASLPSPEQAKQTEQVEEAEQAPTGIEKVACDATCIALRKSCFYMLADVSVNGAGQMVEGLCTSSQMREWEAADTACQVSLITQGVCE